PDARERFPSALAGVTDPQEKRRIIGHMFIDVFRDEARHIENAKFLAQGTLYPDVIESGGAPDGPAATIKTHHNVGGLPKELGFELIEPLRDLFKDEVRKLGLELGLPEEMVWRHPFPGPGLAVRCLGAVTAAALDTLRRADAVFPDELKQNGGFGRRAQAFAARRVSDRHFGVGSDGLILICPSERADARMRMFNADGSEGEMCGNGIRCVGKYVHDRGIAPKSRVTVETLRGVLTLDLTVENG